MGSKQLVKYLQTYAEKDNPIPLIFIFDHDEKEIINQVNDSNKTYKDWGKNVFSFTIPIPQHRQGYENVCIEMYFTDDEIQEKDSQGRQLFLSSSFYDNSGKHKLDPTIHCARPGVLKGCTIREKTKIIDAEVFDANNSNVALSKSDFADHLSQGVAPFRDFNFEEFRKIFNIVEQIVQASQRNQNIYHPNWQEFFKKIDSLEPITQYCFMFRMITDILSLGLQIFIITTIRVYEDEIINEPEKYRKRVAPVKRIITDTFRKPSLNVLKELAEKCFYLVDTKAPQPLQEMKNCLAATIVLEEIGQFWEDLETLFPPDAAVSRIRNKTAIRRDFLLKVIPEIAQYAGKAEGMLEERLIEASNPSIEISTWKKALIKIIKLLQPMFSYPVVFRAVSNRDPVSDEYLVEIKTYQEGMIRRFFEKVQRLGDEYESKSSELVLGDNLRIHMYPLLFIRDDALFFYRRTLSSGYEYYSIILDKIHIEPTKKKFSQSLFRVGSKQELFWTDVLPRQSPVSGIRANIPEEGPQEFIGRRKQINQIKEEIISIVNENGILYGPGGIGKTALMIQLSKELFDEKNKDNVLYENIIWVSAKNNFYDYIFDTIEVREPQIKSLDNILFAVLRFFEFENLEEYNFEDRKELTLELLNDFKVLLIVDNFETVPKGEADKIIEFFGTQVKKSLRRKPENFKIVLTSRELIPSGFRQIELTGLDLRDSKRLIDSLFKRYKSTHHELSSEQKENLTNDTKGIPILIKHCFAKIYEYNEPFDSVLRNLPRYSANIIQFSFREILQQVEKESDQVGLQILILLEIVDIPLMIRQLADILMVEERYIEDKIPNLASFECIKRVNQDNQEKYILNDEIRLLTKSLIQEHRDLLQDIRKKYFRNYSFDKRMDYTSEEEEIISIFEGYIKNREFTDAEDFITKELKKRPNSVLLNYYYAQYLKERRNEIDKAIKILEELRKISRNHPSILKLLFLCYTSSSIPKFESADNLINQIRADLGEYLEQSPDLQLEIARFYIRWSISIKLTRGIDPYEENLRQAHYKELAQKALDILISLENQLTPNKLNSENEDIQLHEVNYRISQCHFNLWDYTLALKMINRAITLVPKNLGVISEYEKFKKNIINTRDFYESKPWIDQRQL